MKFNEIKKPSNKKFGFFILSIFFLISLYYFFVNNFFLAVIFFSITIFLFIITISKPKVLNPLNNAWMFIGYLLGKIVSPIILGIIFYLIISPVSITFKLIKRDELNLKIRKKKTYWTKRDSLLMNNNFFDKQF